MKINKNKEGRRLTKNSGASTTETFLISSLNENFKSYNLGRGLPRIVNSILCLKNQFRTKSSTILRFLLLQLYVHLVQAYISLSLSVVAQGNEPICHYNSTLSLGTCSTESKSRLWCRKKFVINCFHRYSRNTSRLVDDLVARYKRL